MIKLWKFFPVLIVLAVCLGLMLVPVAVPGMVFAVETDYNVTCSVEPATTSVAANGSFSIYAVIDNPDAENVTMHNIQLDFDTSYFTVDSVSLVDFPLNMGTTIDNVNGTIACDPYFASPGKTNATNITSVQINCTAKALEGVSTVSWVYRAPPPVPPRYTKVIGGPIGEDMIGGNWSKIFNGTVIIGSPKLTVDVSPAGKGDVNISGVIPSSYPNVTAWNWSDVVDLEAVENVAGWTFHHWSGDLTGNTSPDTVTMDSAKSVVAHFARYNLTVSSTSGGTVTAPGEATFRYPEGEIVPLQATSDTGYHFVNWTGDVVTIADDTAASTTINMSGDYSIVANFAINQYNLTINSTAGGNTTPSEGVHGPYNHGTVVNLTATHDTNYTFVNWTGDTGTIDDDTAASTTINMSGDYSIVANFTLKQYNLTIDSTAGGNTTPGEGVHTYDHGTVVNLTATHDTNYTFVNWTGNVSEIANVTSSTTNITMIGNYSITANFALKWYNLTINSTLGGNTTPVAGVYSYEHGWVQNLTAEPDAGYAFLEWAGDNSTIANTTSLATNITMDGNYSIWAIFGPHEFDVTPRFLTFTTVEGENPPSQTLEICNTGNGTLNWSVDDNAGWLGESPKDGSLPEQPDCEDVKVSVDVAGMRAGDYTAKITFTGSPPQEVPVILHIESAMEAMPVLPAGLSASALSISPQQVQPGQEVTISINVANTGGKTGSYNAALYINSVVEDSQTVSVAAGASKNVIFTVTKTAAGVYDVSLAGQSGQFQVVGDGGWFGGGGLGTGGIIAIVVVVIILIVAVIFIMRGTARPE